MDEKIEKEKMDYYNLNMCKDILGTRKIYEINTEDAEYIKKYIIPLIDNELKKEKYDKARLKHILLSIDNIN